jgi:hypothetical protein
MVSERENCPAKSIRAHKRKTVKKGLMKEEIKLQTL